MSSVPSCDLHLGALRDQPAEALRERDAARVDADEGDPLEVVRLLDDLVRDAGERPLDRLPVEDDLPRLRCRSRSRAHASRGRAEGNGDHLPAPFRPLWTGLKGWKRSAESSGSTGHLRCSGVRARASPQVRRACSFFVGFPLVPLTWLVGASVAGAVGTAVARAQRRSRPRSRRRLRRRENRCHSTGLRFEHSTSFPGGPSLRNCRGGGVAACARRPAAA